MAIEEALRTILRLIEDTAARPFGLISLLTFAGTTIAYLILRGVDQRWTGRLVWLVFASLIAVGVAVSETQQRSPARYMPPTPGWSIASPPPSGGQSSRAATGGSAVAPMPRSLAGPGAGGPGAPPSGTTGGVPVGRNAASDPPPIGNAPPGPERSSADGTAAAPAPAAAGRAAPPSGQPTVGEESRSGTIVFGRLASQEVTTGNHRCPNPDRGIVNCDNFPTRTTYRVTLEASPTERLMQPELRCLDGPCEASRVHYAQASADGQMVEASFDVWSGPTRWRLTAFREPVQLATPAR